MMRRIGEFSQTLFHDFSQFSPVFRQFSATSQKNAKYTLSVLFHLKLLAHIQKSENELKNSQITIIDVKFDEEFESKLTMRLAIKENLGSCRKYLENK